MSERPAAERREELIALYRELSTDHVCPLAESRTNLVFGTGNANADLMFVGEAPGFHEDRQGKPFVGRAGRLLDELLAEIGLNRDDTFIANVLKCRPPENRDPRPEEIEECTPHLMRQIELIEPKVICTLGNFSTKLLTGRPEGITKVRGVPQVHTLAGLPVRIFPIFHPAAALRTEPVRAQLRDDFRKLPALLDEALGPPPGGGDPAAAAAGGAGEETAKPGDSQLGLFG